MEYREKNEFVREALRRRLMITRGTFLFVGIFSFLIFYNVTAYFVKAPNAGNTKDIVVTSSSSTATNRADALVKEELLVLEGMQKNEQNEIADIKEVSQKSGPFQEHFSGDLSLEEARSEALSDSPDWWVNSGAFLYREGDMGHTITGDLLAESPWFSLYGREDSGVTDGGKKPQNLFRLIKRGDWFNTAQEAYFRVNQYNLSAHSDRGASNGLLLFSRYLDDDNLYYAGLRVDGNVIIKRKVRGNYETLFKAQYISDKSSYNRASNPNLIPVDEWIGLRSEIQDQSNGTTRIRLYIDRGRKYDWQLVGEAFDDGKSYGGSLVTEPGSAGIRTDFMDASFDEYKIREL